MTPNKQLQRTVIRLRRRGASASLHCALAPRFTRQHAAAELRRWVDKTMIESCYWKEELERVARSIRRVPRPVRRSERAHCVVERDLMVGFFMLRRLVELHRVSTATRKRTLRVFSHQARGKKVTRLSGHDLWAMYDLERETAEHRPLVYVANQFIHAYTSFVVRDGSRNWSDVLVVSDYDRNDRIWRVPVAEIEKAFRSAAADYPHSIRMSFNPKKGDYDVETN